MDTHIRVIPTTILLLIAILIFAFGDNPSTLERVKENGKLVVAFRNSPTVYYEGPHGPKGFEYDLTKRFADHLGVELIVIVPKNLEDILTMVNEDEVHFAAAGLTVTEKRKEYLRFTPPYQHITQQLIYRSNSENKRPKKIEDLIGRNIEVVANSSHVERMKELKLKHPQLEWIENKEADSEELLSLVWQQLIDHTVADSNEMALNRRFYPELRIGLKLTDAQPLAWAFAKGKDDSLYNAASVFIENMKKNGEIEQILERYYGHIANINYVGTRIYKRHISRRLPTFREWFEHYAKENNLDWRMLAAIAYQESHWNPKARSPTGVRGIMMLTLATADYLKIKNRLDPEQSIHGGAQYIRKLKKRIPEHIPDPDRTWLALAAYNVGMGHLRDAQIITWQRGGNPEEWNDVRDNLPLLSRKRWYKHTKHGYARGWEPVRYVENIRSYYDLLVWYTENEQRKVEPKATSVDSPVL